MRFRVASAGAGGTIEVRLDSPTGTLVGTTANITPTGDWQVFKDVQLDLATPPTGTHELFLVFRNRGSTQNLFNVNWFEVVGKGAAVTASPEATIAATPTSGSAPLNVAFDTAATDSDGGTPDLRVGLRRPRHRPPTSRPRSRRPTPTRQPGHLHGHADRHRRPGRLDDQDRSRHRRRVLRVPEHVPRRLQRHRSRRRLGRRAPRPDAGRQRRHGDDPVAQAGDVYQTANNAKNLVLRTAPAGPVDDHHEAQLQGRSCSTSRPACWSTATTTTTRSSTASPRTRRRDAVVEKFEFINEVAGTPRNAAADASGNLPRRRSRTTSACV